MQTVHMLANGIGIALLPHNLLALVVAAVLGLIVGAMPGIGAVTGVALLLPLTFSLEPTTAIIMLCAIYYANMYGGSYSAILLNIPGDSSAVMTTLDGYPMTRQGRAGKAIFTANIASFIGGTIGMIVLTFVGPSLAAFGLRFGPAEMTSLLLMAMTSLGWMLGESPLKGFLSTLIGMLLATIGLEPITGMARFNFGVLELLSGVPFIPLVIGLFGFSQVIVMAGRGEARTGDLPRRIRIRDSLPDRAEWRRILPPTLRSGLLGTVVGILPGAGGTIANFFGYIVETKVGRHRAEMGTGMIEGVAASEAANNAAVSGALAPFLSLGIPGSGATAVLLGGLIMWGLTPGPMLFRTSPDFVWGLIGSLYVANVVTLAIGIAVIPCITRIAQVPTRVMIPLISAICLVGSYSATNSLYGVVIMLAAGVLGAVLAVNKYPTAPLLLAFVLSPSLEYNLRKAFVLSNGSLAIFFTRPLSLFFLCLLAVSLALPVVGRALKRTSSAKKGVSP
ncbi:MAG: tripartite tricarboxylate transporter permease [Planctomycetes bacterium]|nr:tripartite tricarboxylate transporter permease [Planctomycetota bacterium]